MDKATQTMIDNLHVNTGKPLEEWIEIVRRQHFGKHGEIMKYLKETHGLTHGFANLIALKAKGADAGSAENRDDLVALQYKGKEHFRPVYDRLIAEVKSFGDEVEIVPMKNYVSIRRKKQFCTLTPASKTRFDIGIILKGQEPEGRLQAEKPNAMCSHKISIAGVDDIDGIVTGWIKAAYEGAG